MLLSVVIPIFNEARHLSDVLQRVRAVPMEKELICVDDCSSDDTWAILQEESQKPGTSVFRHSRNMGKGAAVRTGLGQVHGDVVIIQDADLEYEPDDYIKLLEPIRRGECQVVYGSRFLGRPEAMSLSSALGNRFVTTVANALFRTRLTDLETCYKVFTADIARRLLLVSPRWGFDPEITAKIVRMGYTIREVPISYHGRTVLEGKNLRWHDGFSVLFTLLRFRFLP